MADEKTNGEKISRWFDKVYLKENLHIWVEVSLEGMKKNFRACVTAWTHDDYDLLIENAKRLKKGMDSFIDYLERVRKFG